MYLSHTMHACYATPQTRARYLRLNHKDTKAPWRCYRLLGVHAQVNGPYLTYLGSGESTLALSCLFRNCWVKPLPREQILPTLKGKKGYLQTCGLLCGDHDRLPLSDRLARAGAVRITKAGEMSRTIAGEAHDGDYPLRLYSRIVEIG